MAMIVRWLIELLFPVGSGRRRATTAPAPAPTPEPTPTHAPAPPVRRELPRRKRWEPIDGTEGMIRPYLLAHEQRREAHRQRERRRALVLATMGIDYAGVAL